MKAVVPKEEIIESGDGKVDKDDSGHESDSSDQPKDEKYTKNKSVKSRTNVK